jgi:serine/threonine protein kinase
MLSRRSLIAGRYRVERKIGAGGMGEVWLGTLESIGLRVALKRLLPDAAANPEIAPRFRREAALLARIKSDHVVRVLDFILDDPHSPILVMEYIEGESLSTMIRAHRFTVAEAIELGADLVSALRELHAGRVVHRDLKPGNVLLQNRPDGRRRAVLVDLGVSRLVASDTEPALSEITSNDVALGTMEYMAPEQITNCREASPAADLYAVGAILYRALTGRHAFGDLRGAQLARTKLVADAPRLQTGKSGPAARGLEAVVERALRRVPEERYTSADEMLADLGRLRDLVHAESVEPRTRRSFGWRMRSRSSGSCDASAGSMPRVPTGATRTHGACFASASAALLAAVAALTSLGVVLRGEAGTREGIACSVNATPAAAIQRAVILESTRSSDLFLQAEVAEEGALEATGAEAMACDAQRFETDEAPALPELDALATPPRPEAPARAQHVERRTSGRSPSSDEARFWAEFPGHL